MLKCTCLSVQGQPSAAAMKERCSLPSPSQGGHAARRPVARDTKLGLEGSRLLLHLWLSWDQLRAGEGSPAAAPGVDGQGLAV